MAIKVWNGSAWEMASQIKIWDGSAWQEGPNANVHIWTGSAWQKVHPGVYLDSTYTEGAFDPSGPGAQAQAELTVFSNGKIQTFQSTSTGGTTRTLSEDWLLTATNAEYDVFVTNFSGDALTLSSPTDGTRSALSTTQTYRIVSDYPDGIKTAGFNLNICSNTGSGTVIQVTEVTLTAEAS
jgi:hypothetical protein